MTRKNIWIILRAVITLLAWFAGGYILYRFEYLRAFLDIDNVVGMIPVALMVTCAGGITAIVWMKHSKRYAAVSVALAMLTVLSAALYPIAQRGNWWINLTVSQAEDAKPDLTVYAPFTENSKTAKLDTASTLTLNSALPVLDGATALYPVYAAFAEAVYNKEAYSESGVLCTNTRGAYETVISGKRDIVFVAGASESQLASAKAAGVELKFTPIGREAFVFLTAKGNPVDNLSIQQLRNIYSGKTAMWRTLGWEEGGRIIAFQRPEGSGSQTGLQNIMGKLPVQAPQPLPDPGLIGTNSLMKQISVEWKGVQPALGYSYRYYATTMYTNPDSKLMKIDGIEPSIENIRNGSYPFVADIYAVTNGVPTGNSKLLLDWILSPQGQLLIEKTGYTPLAG